ncbi:MAG: ImmA/IrrE family metallo-endopeptidase [Thermoleophilaceae bacterium]|nr:ImmA/IrrE family metallo-endopeptidase [Thermoleophilaceae bacterium]
MTSGQVDRHRRVGSVEAQRALKRAGMDFETPIDVFGAIEEQQVWLLFQPLDRLYGAYRRHDTPGIVIHAGHPYRLQRFTAAHELGHHLLGHDLSVDSQDEVERQVATLPGQEVEAQAFAATFLMPVQLINRGLAQLGLDSHPSSVDPGQAYRLSLELGSSYSATVVQLRALGRINAANARELLKLSLIDIKTELTLGHRPANARADVWPLLREDAGRTLSIRPDDEVHVRLVESPTTGYRWRPDQPAAPIEIVGDEPVPDAAAQGRAYGAERTRHMWWRALAPTETAVAADLRRSFDPDAVADRFEIALRVLPTITGESDHGVSRRQLQLA